MFTIRSHNRKLILSAFISLVAAVLFVARPLFAQTTPPPASPNTQSVNEAKGDNNDFDDDVKQGKDELKKDHEAQKLQKEVVDGEDQQAGDGENNNIHEDSNLQEADHQEGIDEADQDNNNSEIDEVDDSNNLDQQSQDVIDEHQQEQDREGNQQMQGLENSQPEQNQSGTTGTQDGSSQE